MPRIADSKAEYAAKFKDPRWQRKRLEIMERDQFACVKCGDKDSTLNVHHKFYEFGQAPWEYPPCALVTLCEVCHQDEDEYRRELPQQFFETFASKGWLNSEMSDLIVVFDMFLGSAEKPADIMVRLRRHLVEGK